MFDPRPYDAVVVGARCAGAATAMLLARQGRRVALVDRATFPSDILSTHALVRGGVHLLHRWGLLDAVLRGGAPPVRQVTFHRDGQSVTRPVKPSAGVDLLVAPRRTVLDALLLEAAGAAGVELHTGVTVTGVTRTAGRVDGVTGRDAGGAPVAFAGRFVIGADGLRSRVARAVGAPAVARRAPSGAVADADLAGPASDGDELYVGDRAMAGICPTNGGEANVWVCTPADRADALRGDRTAGYLGLLGAVAPALRERLAGATVTGAVRGTVGLPNHVRRPWGPGWVLVGDAAEHRDPMTSHGMTGAFRDAELASRAVGAVLRGELDERWATTAFSRLRHDLAHEIFDASAAMAQFPPTDEFVAHHRRATDAIQAESQFLFDLPPQPAPLGALATAA